MSAETLQRDKRVIVYNQRFPYGKVGQCNAVAEPSLTHGFCVGGGAVEGMIHNLRILQSQGYRIVFVPEENTEDTKRSPLFSRDESFLRRRLNI